MKRLVLCSIVAVTGAISLGCSMGGDTVEVTTGTEGNAVAETCCCEYREEGAVAPSYSEMANDVAPWIETRLDRTRLLFKMWYVNPPRKCMVILSCRLGRIQAVAGVVLRTLAGGFAAQLPPPVMRCPHRLGPMRSR